MNANDRADRLLMNLPDVLAALEPSRQPDYADALFERLETARQRPRWSFGSRWLPGRLVRLHAPRPPVATWRLLFVSLLILALVAAAVVFVGSRRKLPPPFGPAAPGVIVYVADNALWSSNADGSGARALTLGERLNLHPVFSPDGTRIAFARLAEVGSHPNWEEWSDVVVIDADGTHEVVLERERQGVSPFTWSADSSSIVYSAIDEGRDQIFVARADASSTRMITTGTDASWSPVLAPDGRHVAYVKGYPDILGIDVLDIDGRADEPLTKRRLRTFNLGAWSPDGQTLLYAAHDVESADNDIWLIDARSHEEHPLVTGVGNASGPAWSPDGREIVYLDEVGPDQSRVTIVGREGGRPRVVSELGAWTYPQWSPDGKRVLVNDQALHGGSPALVLLDPSGLEAPDRLALPDTQGLGRSDLPSWQRLAP
jgi:hypothetical protein